MKPSVRRKKSSWMVLAKNVFQGPMDNPQNTDNKVLAQLQAIRREVFMRNVAEQAEKCSWGVLHPECTFRLVWDLILILLVVEQAIAVPYIISFNVTLSDSMSRFDTVSVFIFFFDISTPHAVINFNTSYFAKGSLVGHRAKIAKNYLKLWFWLDAVSSFPFSWLSDGIGNTRQSSGNDLSSASNLLLYVRFLRFLRILRLIRLIKLKSLLVKIEDFIASNTIAYIFMLTRISFLIFFIAHWIACGFYYVGFVEADYSPETWTTQISEHSNAEDYVTALYYAFSTMTTVGYGDITPYTTNERIYVTCAMILSCCTFAYMIGSIGSIVEKQNAEANTYRERVVNLNLFMRQKDLPMDLQFRVRRFLEYVWSNQSKDLEDKEILEWLSDPLKDEIYAQVNGAVITRCPAFKDFEQGFILQLSKLLIAESFAPGDVIFEEGQLGSKMYYILHGSVDVHHFATSSSFKMLTVHHFFGEIGFFAPVARCASTRCLEFSDVLAISREDMNSLLEKYPESKERTRVIGVRVAAGDLAALYVRCYICKAVGHVATRCRQVLLNLDHDDVRRKWLHARSNHTKYINPHAPPFSNYSRSDRPQLRFRYDSKCVVGVKRDIEQMFPNEPLIIPAARVYMQHAEREKNKTASTVDLSNSAPEEVPRRRKKPRYTIIYKDSSGSEDEGKPSDEPDASPAKPRRFRRSLLQLNGEELLPGLSAGELIEPRVSDSTDFSSPINVLNPFRQMRHAIHNVYTRFAPVRKQETVKEITCSQEFDHDVEPFFAQEAEPYYGDLDQVFDDDVQPTAPVGLIP